MKIELNFEILDTLSKIEKMRCDYGEKIVIYKC